MGSIFVTADWHFYHNKDFVYEPRGFKSVEAMTNALIMNHNTVVEDEDDVYVLGDLIVGGEVPLEQSLEAIKRLKGKLHLVRGNHDSDKRWEAFRSLPNVVEMENAIYLDYKKYHFYLSHYPTITSNWDYDKPLRQRLLNICGHTHTKDRWLDGEKGFIYHCEVDAHGNYPVLLDTVIMDFLREFTPMTFEEKLNELGQPIPSGKIYCNDCGRKGYCKGIDWTGNCPNFIPKTILKCYKCVYEDTSECPGPKPDGTCEKYKRDPPDGGYYG